MNDFFKKLMENLKATWAKWKLPQRLAFFGVIGAVVLVIILAFAFSSGPNLVPVLSKPVTDEDLMERITNGLEAEGIEYVVSADKRLMVKDAASARKAKAILVREDLVPTDEDPWALFDVERWTQTDFERNVNLRRAIENAVEQHIQALSDVDSANVVIQMPEKTLFAEDQDPVTASVILSPRPGSDIATNRKKIEGIEKLINRAVPGLKKEDIVITDLSGVQLNDWANTAMTDSLDLKQRELKIKRSEEVKYIKTISGALAQMFGEDRVKIVNTEVTLDMGHRTSEKTEVTPIEVTPDNPLTPFSEREVVMNVPISEQKFNEDFKGSGWNPEGPAGVEGQTPPAMKDLSGLVGQYNRTDNRTNYEINKTVTKEDGQPEIRRISVAVAIDGVWRKAVKSDGSFERNTDGSIKREYVPLSDDQLKSAQRLVEAAVGYSAIRGDLIRVENLMFDRTKEHAAEDDAIRRAEQTQQIVLFSLIGLAAILVIFIVFRLVSREIERRRRLREEELARQHQAMREAALRSAEEESTEVEMSVEERARLELQEHAVNMAREHPEEVAALIRTWLIEE